MELCWGESKRDCAVTHFNVQNMSCENEIFQKIKKQFNFNNQTSDVLPIT